MVPDQGSACWKERPLDGHKQMHRRTDTDTRTRQHVPLPGRGLLSRFPIQASKLRVHEVKTSTGKNSDILTLVPDMARVQSEDVGMQEMTLYLPLGISPSTLTCSGVYNELS